MRFWYLTAVLWVICCALPSRKQYSVRPELLPGLSEIVDKSLIPEMYAGHLPLVKSNANEDEIEYFFWKFSRSDKVLKTLIIWLNGGPGCSSMDGALVENGPFRVNQDLKLVINEGSWHTRADILYVDQPVNSGFSVFSDRNKIRFENDLTVLTQHFMEFLENYFKVFPEDQFKDLVIAGESFAGQYVPHLAEAIEKRNSEIQDDLRKYNLRGILIGNGWMDPDSQSLNYLPFAISKGIIDKEDSYFSTLLSKQQDCQRIIMNKPEGDQQSLEYEQCEDVLLTLLDVTRDSSPETPPNRECMNMYSYNLRDSFPACGSNWPAEVLNVPGFFDVPGVLEALNLDSSKTPQWQECNTDVYNHLRNTKAVPSVHKLPALLESGIKVILYAGDLDILCNEMGITDMINKLKWSGAQGFSRDAKRYAWKFRDYDADADYNAGYVLSDRNLTYVSVYNASHMVPNDQALRSRGLVEIYLGDALLELHETETLVTTSEKNRDNFDNNNLGVLGIADGKTDQEEELEHEIEQYAHELDDGKGEESDSNSSNANKNEGNVDTVDHVDSQGHQVDENAEEDKNEQEPGSRIHQGNFGIFGIIIFVALAFGSLGLYIYLRKHTRKTRAILVDPSRRQQESQNKSVSWADDLERGYASENDRTGPSNVRSKGSYTRVPNTEVDESFELENL